MGCAGVGGRADAFPIVDPSRVPVTADDPIRGPRGGQRRIVVFSDFECPYCKAASRDLTRLQRELPGIALVFKNLPLPMHSAARPLAALAQAAFFARGDDAFWAIHDGLMALRDTPSDRALLALVEASVPLEELEPVLARASDKVTGDLALAKELGLTATPHLFVGRRSVEGLWPYADFRDLAVRELGS